MYTQHLFRLPCLALLIMGLFLQACDSNGPEDKDPTPTTIDLNNLQKINIEASTVAFDGQSVRVSAFELTPFFIVASLEARPDSEQVIVGLDDDFIPSGEVVGTNLFGRSYFGEGLSRTVTGNGAGSDVVTISGTLVNVQDENDTQDFQFRITESQLTAGSSTLEVREGKAYLEGDLGTQTYNQVIDLYQQHPDVKTIVLTDVPGSINDQVNVQTGRIVRAAGYTTHVPAGGQIASGGVDLFVAGQTRILEEGAMVGVHAWCCIDGKGASEVSRNHPDHNTQIQYFTEMMGSRGRDFYFYTLEAAGFEDIHYMTPSEIEEWGLQTG